jgi:putative ABC transport system ATP-binding protein
VVEHGSRTAQGEESTVVIQLEETSQNLNAPNGARSKHATVSAREIDSLNRDGLTYSVDGLVLPEGVTEVVCDHFVRQLPRHELCAVVFENRLLILPIGGHLLDESYVQVVPHKSVWESLGIRRATPNFANRYPEIPTDVDLAFPSDPSLLSRTATSESSSLIDLTRIDPSGQNVGRLVNRLSTGEIVIDLTTQDDLRTQDEVAGFEDIAEDEPAPVMSREFSARLHVAENEPIARPLRSGQRPHASAIELSDVTVRLAYSKSGSRGEPLLEDHTVLRVSLQIGAGETVAIVGARKRAARMLMSLIVGLEEPATGLVFHQGVPIGLPSLDGERWKLALPGVLPRRMVDGAELSVLDYVSQPMQLFGITQSTSHKWALTGLDDMGARVLADQPFDSLLGPDRRLVALTRALVGPWPMRFLFDPLYGFTDETAAEARRVIQKYAQSVATLVLLTDDPELLRLADRVLGVSDGQVYEAVRRG